MKYPKAIINKLNAITEKRPSTVIQHILKYGFITTEELKGNMVMSMRLVQQEMSENDV